MTSRQNQCHQQLFRIGAPNAYKKGPGGKWVLQPQPTPVVPEPSKPRKQFFLRDYQLRSWEIRQANIEKMHLDRVGASKVTLEMRQVREFKMKSDQLDDEIAWLRRTLYNPEHNSEPEREERTLTRGQNWNAIFKYWNGVVSDKTKLRDWMRDHQTGLEVQY